MLAVVNVGQGGFGIGITRSRLISNSHSSGSSHPPDVVFFVTVNLLSPLTQSLYPVTTLTPLDVISGHGGFGIGINRSRLIANSHSSGSSHPPDVVFFSTVNLLSPLTQSLYPVTTLTPPDVMSGHGGFGIGINRSRLMSNEHSSAPHGDVLLFLVTVTLLPPVMHSL